MPFAETLTAIGSALGGAASIGGAIQGFRSYKKAKKYADYTDKLNDENYRMQLADTERLIQEDRLYNDFSSVAARARSAGINPLAVIGNGNAGGQSISASVPSASAPLSSNGDFGASTISQSAAGILGATEQFALLDARRRAAEAEASIAESEAKWRDKQLAQDYENSVTYNDFLDAGILDKKASARLATAQAECQDIQKEILSVDRNVATATEQMRIDKFRTSLDLALDELKRSNIDTEFKRERVQAELDNLNAMTDSITQHIAIDWKNSEIAEMNAHTALKEYGLSREEFVSLDKYRDDIVRLEEQDQKLREKIERKRNTKDYIIHAADWINDRAKIAAEKERITNEYGKSASSTALQLLGIASKFVK